MSEYDELKKEERRLSHIISDKSKEIADLKEIIRHLHETNKEQLRLIYKQGDLIQEMIDKEVYEY